MPFFRVISAFFAKLRSEAKEVFLSLSAVETFEFASFQSLVIFTLLEVTLIVVLLAFTNLLISPLSIEASVLNVFCSVAFALGKTTSCNAH